jgi:hypothetical protein
MKPETLCAVKGLSAENQYKHKQQKQLKVRLKLRGKHGIFSNFTIAVQFATLTPR